MKVTSRSGPIQTVATGTLSAGSTQDGGHECRWTFSVSRVRDAEVYKVEVINGPGVVYSELAMQRKNWNVTMGIGFTSR